MRWDEPVQWQTVPTEPPGPLDPVPPAPAQRPRRGWRRPFGFRWRHIILALLAIFMLLVAWLAITAPLSKSLQPIAAPSLTLVSAEGEPIARRGAEIGKPVEDRRAAQICRPRPSSRSRIARFYHHFGISPRGIARAAFRNIGAGGVREGGSTITQQLAKISFLNAERTAARKAQEVLIAFWLEAWLTKNQILERYLSNVYFGDNVYGLRAASWHYFSHGPEQLTIRRGGDARGHGARRPRRSRPTAQSRQGARQRAKVVIGTMVRDHVITAAQSGDAAAGAAACSRRRRRYRPAPISPTGCCQSLARGRSKATMPMASRRVQTTLEARLQKLALQTRAQCRARQGAGGAGRDASRRARRRDGRRQGLCGEPVQPRHPGAPPARLDVQIVRLSGRDARGHDAGFDRSRTSRSRSAPGSRRIAAAIIAARSPCARPLPSRAMSPPCGVSREGRAAERDSRRARSRHHQPARRQSQPRARHVGRHPARADPGLCGGRGGRLSGAGAWP